MWADLSCTSAPHVSSVQCLWRKLLILIHLLTRWNNIRQNWCRCCVCERANVSRRAAVTEPMLTSLRDYQCVRVKCVMDSWDPSLWGFMEACETVTLAECLCPIRADCPATSSTRVWLPPCSNSWPICASGLASCGPRSAPTASPERCLSVPSLAVCLDCCDAFLRRGHSAPVSHLNPSRMWQ